MKFISVTETLPNYNEIVLCHRKLKGLDDYFFGGIVEVEEGWLWGYCYSTCFDSRTQKWDGDIETDDEYIVENWLPMYELKRKEE